MRKLASIQRIKALEPIENADSIEKATVLGWQLVVKKGQFKVGDLCVYCEIDSLFPDKPEFEFLKPRAMRIRTVRLRGQISQGICFPLDILPQHTPIDEGNDVTAVLEISKYEPAIPAQLAGLAKGLFPSFILKTDETRIQVLQDVLDKYKHQKCFVTEKLDGSSVTYFFKDGEFGVCSRNLELLETEDNSLWKMARKFDLKEKLMALGKNIALQGEIIGEGIQGNKYGLKGQIVYFFNVFEIDTFQYQNFEDFIRTTQNLGIKAVPVLENEFLLENSIEFLVGKAKQKSVLNPKIWAEGIVIRLLEEKNETGLGRVSFKAINPEFLLKYE